jgi:hypothetical protein
MSQWLSIMLCYDEPLVVNHGVLCWASDCESLCVMLSQLLWIMVCYYERVVVNHGVLCWSSGCESWWIMLWKVVVNHDALPVCWAKWFGIMVCSVKLSGCELWCIMPRKVVVNHDVIPVCWTQWLGIMVFYAEPVIVNHGELCWASGYESCCVILSQWL